MTLCSESSLVNVGDNRARAVTLYCNSWACDICEPRRKAGVIAAAASGQPERMITLTIRPTPRTSADQDARFMSDSWRVLVRRIKAAGWCEKVHYFAVFERHKSGRPHMHVLQRGGYIDAKWIKREWEKITGSWNVKIEKIHNPKRCAGYVAKYIGKDPHRFGKCKRYWSTKGWEVDPPEPKNDEGHWSDTWERRDQTLQWHAACWQAMGWGVWTEGETLYGAAAPPPGVRLLSPEAYVSAA